MLPPIDPAVEKRVRWLLRLLLAWAFLILARLGQLQIAEHPWYAELAEHQQTQLVEMQAHRGVIYDRNGRVLAITVPVETVVVNPLQLPNLNVAAQVLAEILDLSAADLEATLEAKKSEKRQYYVVAPRVTQEQANRLRSLNLGWIQFESSSVRVYPNGTLAAHLLGGVDHEMHGNAGIEQGLDDELSGRSGYSSMVTDVQHRGFESKVELEPVAGNDVYLTIDYRLQYEVEKALAKAVEDDKCWSGRVVVADPQTGEILAMASYPTYNPNERVANFEARQNLAVQSAIEPGSVFKVFTIASAIEEHKVTPTTGFFCNNGRLNLFGRVIKEAKHGYGYLSVEDILAKSSNIGAIHVAQTIGEKTLFDYIKLFGFGAKTGVPLPGESPGRLIRLSRWTKSSIGSVAMGHEIMVTSLQLTQGVSIIANGGKFVRPKLVRRVVKNSAGGPQLRQAAWEEPSPHTEPVIAPETVVTMRKMMEHVVLNGTGKDARVPGYTVGGKTGSAQIYDPKVKHYLSKYHASFMGFAPVNDPRVAIIITLNGSSKFGGVVAAPVFSKVAGAALRVLNVPRTLPDEPAKQVKEDIPLEDVSFADLTEEKPVEDKEILKEAELTEVKAGLITPNYLGKPLREVLEKASANGFRIESAGAGLVRQQTPSPGEPISYGAKIRLRLGR